MMAFASLFLGNEWARLAGVAVICFGVGWVRGFDAVPRPDIPAIVANAEAARDAAWQTKLTEANKLHDKKLNEAIEAGASVPAIASDDELAGLCRKSPTCRDKSRASR
jgi:hypothetical protein